MFRACSKSSAVLKSCIFRTGTARLEADFCMKILNRREPIILFVGDLLAFSVALWLALTFRYGSVPSQELLLQHLTPFSILFALWTVVFFYCRLVRKTHIGI